jgi:integral membrane protein
MFETFRSLSLIEGISLITLFFVAMPAKYYLGVPVIVPLVGTTHGLLFVSYLVLSLVVSHCYKWSLFKWLMVLAAGFIPFACFLLEKQLKREAKLT